MVTCGVPEGELAPCVAPVGLVAPAPPTPIVGETDVAATLGPCVGLGCEQGTTQSAGFDSPPAPGPPPAPGSPPSPGCPPASGPPPGAGPPPGVPCSLVEIFKLISTSTPSG